MHWLRIVTYSLVVVFSVFAFAASAIWPEHSDLWLNLFAEAIGVAFIVVVVENLIRLADQRRSKPARYAAFKETLLVYNRLVTLWFQMVQAAFKADRHGGILEIEDIRLLDPRFGEIVMRLNLDAEAPVRPKRNWRYFLAHQIDHIERSIDRCLQRYSAFMEPELIQCLQELEQTSFFQYGKLQTSLPAIAEELGVRQSPYFGWGGKSSAGEMIGPLNRLAVLLARYRPGFDGMPGIPAAIDHEHRSELALLRRPARVGAPDIPTSARSVQIESI